MDMKFQTACHQSHINLQTNISLSSYTSLRIGGNADYLALPTSTNEIRLLIAFAKQYHIPYYILGNGSNTLVVDEGVRGLVIVLSENFASIHLSSPTTITCDAGIALMDVCLFAYQQGLTGLEFAYGIPASCGGAMYMNAGAYGGEMKDVVCSCTFLDEQNELQTLPLDALELRYRHSYFSDKKMCILSITFQLEHGNPTCIKEQMDENLHRRQTKQPLEFPSAGSTFKRPLNHYASALIDQCGLKGHQIGGAQVSTKHAGFVINADNATSSDILSLIDHIKKVVFDTTGYQLECEMKIIN